MSLLTEAFKKYDKLQGKKDNLELEKSMIEDTYKDNEILQRYIKLIKQINKIEEEDKAKKDNLYALNQEQDEPLDMLTGKNCEVTFTKPYTKNNWDSKNFEIDFFNIDEDKEKTKYKYYKEIYTKYCKKTNVKGSAKVKLLKE